MINNISLHIGLTSLPILNSNYSSGDQQQMSRPRTNPDSREFKTYLMENRDIDLRRNVSLWCFRTNNMFNTFEIDLE